MVKPPNGYASLYSGAPHGSVLVPAVFVLCVCGPVNELKSITSQFASDKKVVGRALITKGYEAIQTDLDKIIQ